MILRLISYTRCLFQTAVLRSRTKLVYLIRPCTQAWWHCFIHKRLWNVSCVRHNRLACYALCRAISYFSTSYFYDCVSKVVVVGKKAQFAMLRVHLTVLSLMHHNVISCRINRNRVFHLKWSDSTWPKPNHDLGHWDALIVNEGGQKRNLTSRRVFTQRCSDTDGLLHNLHFLYVITGWSFMFSVVWYHISQRLTFMIVSPRSWSSVRKQIFAMLRVQLTV